MMTYSMARQGCSVDEILRAAVDFAFDGIDWVTTYGRPAAELRRRSEDAGLPVVAYTFFFDGFTAGKADWLDGVKRELESAVTLGAPLVMVPTPPLAGCADRIEGQKRWIDALAQAAPLVRASGLIYTFENFPGRLSPFVTAADFFAARAVIPELALTFDDGNAASGEDMLESYRLCRDCVRHVHFKDWYAFDAPAEDRTPTLDGRYFKPALVGDGVIDSPAMLRALRESGYDGFINIEYEGNDIPAREAMRLGLERLRAAEPQDDGAPLPRQEEAARNPRKNYTGENSRAPARPGSHIGNTVVNKTKKTKE